jgi:hypothetical protein
LLEGLILHARAASGLMRGGELDINAFWHIDKLQVGKLVLKQAAAVASSICESRRRTSMDWPLRLMPPCRTFFSRRAVRRSPASDSAFLDRAACMSTCSMKCTPPRKSSPRYMGAACSAESQAGERDSRLSATT